MLADSPPGPGPRTETASRDRPSSGLGIVALALAVVLIMVLTAQLAAILGPDFAASEPRPVTDSCTVALLFYTSGPHIGDGDSDLHVYRHRLSSFSSSSSCVAPEALAGAGFHAREPTVQCHACRHEPPPEAGAGDPGQHHGPGCAFRLLRRLALDPHAPLGADLARFQRHLAEQWATTRVTVAKEMQYDEDLILFAVARRYRRHGSAHPDAGSLVDDLFGLEFEGAGAGPLVVRSAAAAVQRAAAKSPPESGPDGATARPPPRPTPTPASPDNGRRRALYEETARLLARTQCRVCQRREADRLIVDCSHLVLCHECQPAQARCPLCGTPITDFVRIYTS